MEETPVLQEITARLWLFLAKQLEQEELVEKVPNPLFIPFILVSGILFFISDPGWVQAIFSQALILTTWLPCNSRLSSTLNEEGEKEGMAEMVYTLV